MAGLSWIVALALAQPTPDTPAPPVWIEPPAMVAADYPSSALELGLSGTATLQCLASDDGVPNSCTVVEEDPAGYGFGAAAIQVVERSRMNPAYVATVEPPASFRLRIPFALQRSDPVIVVSGNQAGAATLRCRLSDMGVATDCGVLDESPQDAGVGQQAAVFLQSFALPPGLIPSATPGQEFNIRIEVRPAQP